MKFYAIRKTVNGVESWATRSYCRRTSYRNMLDQYTRLYYSLSSGKRSLTFARSHQYKEDPTLVNNIQLVELELVTGQVVV